LNDLNLNEFNTIYDNIKDDLARLKVIKFILSEIKIDSNSNLENVIGKLLNKEEELIEKYSTIKKNLLNEIQVISVMVSAIATMDIDSSNYAEIRTELELLMRDTQDIQEKIEI
jgi:hypothetical protein